MSEDITKSKTNDLDFLNDLDAKLVVEGIANLIQKHSEALEITQIYKHDAPTVTTNNTCIISWDSSTDYRLIVLGGKKYSVTHKVKIDVIIADADTQFRNEKVVSMGNKIAKLLLNNPVMGFSSDDIPHYSIGQTLPLTVDSVESGTFVFGDNQVYGGVQLGISIPVRFSFGDGCGAI